MTHNTGVTKKNKHVKCLIHFISSAHTKQESDMMSCLIGLQGNQFHYQTHQCSSSSKNNSYIVEANFLQEINAKCDELHWSDH